MSYKVRDIGTDLSEEDWRTYIMEQFKAIEFAFAAPKIPLIPILTSAPVNPSDGMIVGADGTSWNPGSGAGYYGYRNGAWHFLG